MFTDMFGCDFSLIRVLAQSIHMNSGLIVPAKYELVLMLYRQEYSIRKMRKGLRIHPTTIYKFVKQFIEDGQPEFGRKLDDRSFEQVVKFMTQFNTIVSRWHPCV